MTAEENTKYNKLIERADNDIDSLTFEERELLQNTTESKISFLQKKFRKLARDVDDAVIELQVLQFLED